MARAYANNEGRTEDVNKLKDSIEGLTIKIAELQGGTLKQKATKIFLDSGVMAAKMSEATRQDENRSMDNVSATWVY